MSRYKYTKLKNLGPVHGFFINTPDGRTIKDIYPQFIVRELNRLNDRINRLEEFVDQLTNPKFTRDDLPKEALLQYIKRLEEAGDRLAGTTPPSSDRYMAWLIAKEAKP